MASSPHPAGLLFDAWRGHIICRASPPSASEVEHASEGDDPAQLDLHHIPKTVARPDRIKERDGHLNGIPNRQLTSVPFQQPQSPFDNDQDEIGWPIAPLHMAHFRLSFGPQ